MDACLLGRPFDTTTIELPPSIAVVRNETIGLFIRSLG
jgi:hypothetical protein